MHKTKAYKEIERIRAMIDRERDSERYPHPSHSHMSINDLDAQTPTQILKSVLPD